MEDEERVDDTTVTFTISPTLDGKGATMHIGFADDLSTVPDDSLAGPALCQAMALMEAAKIFCRFKTITADGTLFPDKTKH